MMGQSVCMSVRDQQQKKTKKHPRCDRTERLACLPDPMLATTIFVQLHHPKSKIDIELNKRPKELAKQKNA